MPRGKKAKANRKYKRACASGSSTRGASLAASTQQKGRKYSKGETSSYFDLDIKTFSYEGNLYDIHYNLNKNVLDISGVYKVFSDSNTKNVIESEIKDTDLKMKIINWFIENHV